MLCSSDNRRPPSDHLDITSKVDSTLLSDEVSNVSEELKKAGVVEVIIEPSWDKDAIRIRPVDGNNDQIMPILDKIRDNLAKAGIDSVERPLLRCPGTPW